MITYDHLCAGFSKAIELLAQCSKYSASSTMPPINKNKSSSVAGGASRPKKKTQLSRYTVVFSIVNRSVVT